jgi:hypothetical protein
MKERDCPECGQPISPGRHRPGEYEHAQGCPRNKSKVPSKLRIEPVRSIIKCLECGTNSTVFRSKEFEIEYGHSGLCQTCQDKNFGGKDWIKKRT